jgi:thymidylate synthase ThyX
MYDCKIIADSVAGNGVRLTTFEVTYPLIIHAEIMTHRVFSRNVASNRAIPVKKLIASVQENPFVPERFPKNQAGMQNAEWLEGDNAAAAEAQWLYARDQAVKFAESLQTLDVHKQISNRLLAPFLWTTAVITATEWDNFWSLRCHPMAQPEIQKIAYMMADAYKAGEPQPLGGGAWHLPYISTDTIYEIAGELYQEGKSNDEVHDAIIKVSIGRCARVSYLNHGEGNPWRKDLELAERLISSKHMSPTEHVATPETIADFYDGAEIIPTLAISYTPRFYGNFRGWKQYRKFIPNESGEACRTTVEQ